MFLPDIAFYERHLFAAHSTPAGSELKHYYFSAQFGKLYLTAVGQCHFKIGSLIAHLYYIPHCVGSNLLRTRCVRQRHTACKEHGQHPFLHNKSCFWVNYLFTKFLHHTYIGVYAVYVHPVFHDAALHIARRSEQRHAWGVI